MRTKDWLGLAHVRRTSEPVMEFLWGVGSILEPWPATPPVEPYSARYVHETNRQIAETAASYMWIAFMEVCDESPSKEEAKTVTTYQTENPSSGSRT